MAVNLPIHVSQEELQENPAFAALLQDLSANHVTKEGVSKSKADKLDYCTLALQKEKKLYLQSLLFYTAINEMVLDSKLNPNSQEEGKFYDMLSRAMNTAEAGMVLQENMFPRIDAQTLREFQIGDEESVKQQIKILGAKLLPKLEAYMEEKIITISNFYETTNNKKELQIAKGLQLGEVIATKKQQANLLAQGLQVDILHNTRAFWEYYKVLESVATSLYTLINNYKLRENSQDSSMDPDPYILTAEWQYVRLQTLSLKLEVVEQQMAEETYGDRETSSPLEGLRSIASHLQRASDQARWAHEKAISRKSQYESVGLGFSDLASEYGKLLKAIANKEWAIQELDMQ